MTWPDVLLSKVAPGGRLSAEIDSLLEHQRNHWELFRSGEAALRGLRKKVLSIGGIRIVVQANPRRRASVHAKVDVASVSRRACFLCAENLPPEERGIGFGDLVLLPNPHPILGRHLTIASMEHQPQRMAGRVPIFLELLKSVGPDMAVTYNSANCGASAPDHFHFQACSTADIPLFEEIRELDERQPVYPHASLGRRMLVIRHCDGDTVAELIQRTLAMLPRSDAANDEPMFNVVARLSRGRYEACVFPRAKHRPSCYFEEGDAKVSVSPAAVEMAGVLVLADVDQFERLDERVAGSVFDEVSLEPDRFQALAKELG